MTSHYEKVDLGNVKGEAGTRGADGVSITGFIDTEEYLDDYEEEPIQKIYHITFSDNREPTQVIVKDGANLTAIDTIRQNSTKPVESSAIYTALASKSNTDHTHYFNETVTENNNTTVVRKTLEEKLASIEQEIQAIRQHDFIHVENSLPTQDIDEKAMYLIPSTNSSSNNLYEEYVWNAQNSDWEHLGEFNLNLSNYATTQALNWKQDKTNISNDLTSDASSTTKYPSVKAVADKYYNKDEIDDIIGDLEDFLMS